MSANLFKRRLAPLVVLLSLGYPSKVAAQASASGGITKLGTPPTNPRPQAINNQRAAQDRCIKETGLWQTNHCYVFLKNKITMAKAGRRVDYPASAAACSTSTGVWNSNRCYLALAVGRGTPGIRPANKEECKGSWVVNKDGDGFCFEKLPQIDMKMVLVDEEDTTLFGR